MALIATFGMLNAACSADPPDNPPEPRYEIPADACGRLDLTPFIDVLGEFALDMITEIEPGNAICTQFFSGTRDSAGRREPGGSVDVLSSTFPSAAQARASFDRSPPGFTSPFPKPITIDVDDVRYGWSHRTATLLILDDNLILYIGAESRFLDSSPPPEELPRLVEMLAEHVLADVMGGEKGSRTAAGGCAEFVAPGVPCRLRRA